MNSNPPIPVPEKKAAHILIVEDNILQRLTLGEWLRHEGYVVLEASSADEASVILASSLIVNLVITDVLMPGMIDGIDFARYVRRVFPYIPVIIVSGKVSGREAEDAHFPFFQKPYDLDKVSACITKLLNDTVP